jgi:cytochrome c553
MALTPQTLADIAAFLQALPPPATPASKGPGEALAHGKTLFERDCVGCHDAQGEGQAAEFRPRLAAQHYNYLVHELERIRSGARGNSDPGMRALLQAYAPADLQAVADHLSRLPPERP